MRCAAWRWGCVSRLLGDRSERAGSFNQVAEGVGLPQPNHFKQLAGLTDRIRPSKSLEVIRLFPALANVFRPRAGPTVSNPRPKVPCRHG
jgi:hypothetical protein